MTDSSQKRNTIQSHQQKEGKEPTNCHRSTTNEQQKGNKIIESSKVIYSDEGLSLHKFLIGLFYLLHVLPTVVSSCENEKNQLLDTLIEENQGKLLSME